MADAVRTPSVTPRVTARAMDSDAARLRADTCLSVARRAVGALFGAPAERAFAVRYWTGAEERAAARSPGAPRFTLVIRRPGALRRMCLPPSELALGEAFVRGDFDVEGDLEAAVGLGPVIAARLRSPRATVRLAALLLRLPARNDDDTQREEWVRSSGRWRCWYGARARAAASIRFHYDVGNDFYGLWLDARRVYSCAYFAAGGENIDAAQSAKLEHICRKLRLRPGERLLDIGCGWGGLIRYAAAHFGVEAVGITLSPSQAAYACERIAAEGLGGRCRAEVRDYRDLAGNGVFDKIVSVGMFEHVGRKRLAAYFRTAYRLLRPGGLFMNHGIVSLEQGRPVGLRERLRRVLWRQGEFLDRYVFPDGELAPLSTAVGHAEAAGFETRDVESLREHYTLTLRHWVRRLEAREFDAVALAGEPATYRVWRLYMAASAYAFATARIGIAQLLLARPDASGRCDLPATRADLYAAPSGALPSPIACSAPE